MRKVFYFFFITVLLNSCYSQSSIEPAEKFVERFKTVVNSENTSMFLSELVVSEHEFIDFMKVQWNRELSKSQIRKMKARLDQSLERGWKELNRDSGVWVGNGLINKQNKFTNTLKNCEYYDIEVNDSKDAGKNFGEMMFAEITVISAKFKPLNDPEKEHKILFPCTKTKNGQWKIVYRILIM